MHERRYALWTLALCASVAMLIAPALWNGFPLLQYDTGGYLAPWIEGKLLINRSVPYGLMLMAGLRLSFWPVIVLQAVLTVWVLALTLRAHHLGNRPLLLLGIVAALSALTTLPWLTAILLTDIFAPLGALALYLLFRRDHALNGWERAGLVLLIAVAAATHSATLAMFVALTAFAVLVWLVDRRPIAFDRILRGVTALALGILMVFAANGVIAGRIAWTPGGFALSFGRMLQDGIVKRYLDDRCPDASLRLCAYKDQLPRDADEFFWGDGVFNKLGRFDGYSDEMRRIALEALAAYPLLQLKSVVSETAAQIVKVRTGGGVVRWVWDTYSTIKAAAPDTTPAIEASRQWRDLLGFDAINAFQVPIAWLSMALLPVIMVLAWPRRQFRDICELAATVALAILANAAVFGTLATAHNRYGARIVWIATFAVLLSLARLYAARHEHPRLPR